LFHCAGGKDRTGIVTAVLLGVLGVPDEVILDDYELTSTFFTPRKLATLAAVMEEHGVPESQVLPLLQARRPVLATLLSHVHERAGGFAAYAREHLGVSAELPTRLRRALLA
jgi:protein-tyrosine phosphatase